MFCSRLIPVSLLCCIALLTDEKVPTSSEIQWGSQVIYALEVPDSGAAAEWYGRALGCEVLLDLSEMGWVEVSSPVPGAVIGLGQPEPGQDARDNGGSSISFEVHDIEATRALLVERGVDVGEIKLIPETVKLLELHDPWGNRLMLVQSLER